MKSYFFAFTLLCGALFLNPAVSHAKDAETLAAAQKLVDHLIGSTFLEQMSQQSWRAIASDLKTKNPGIDADKLEEFRLVFLEIQKEFMDEILSGTPQIYARFYTKEELEELYKFQTSSLGKKTLEVTPKIMGEMMPKIIRKSQTFAPRIQQLMRKRIKEKGYKI